MSKWISVKDRLPDFGQFVLTYSQMEAGHWVWLYGAVQYNGYFVHTNPDSITHWMPLPEPPQEQDDD